MLLLRYPLRVALVVAIALAQIGEFSFILATVASELGLLNESATNTLVAVAILSITLNPLLYKLVRPLDIRLSRIGLGRLSSGFQADVRLDSAQAAGIPDLDGRHRAVVVGYGPVGRTVTRLLRENGVSPTIIDLNLDAVRRVREEGLAAVYGDASHRQTLIEAGVANAGALILSSAGMRADAEIIRLARELNPPIHILARVVYLRDVAPLRRAGADLVFSGEGEVALAFTEAVLRDLGATPEQIDREREHVHAELSGE